MLPLTAVAEMQFRAAFAELFGPNSSSHQLAKVQHGWTCHLAPPFHWWWWWCTAVYSVVAFP